MCVMSGDIYIYMHIYTYRGLEGMSDCVISNVLCLQWAAMVCVEGCMSMAARLLLPESATAP